MRPTAFIATAFAALLPLTTHAQLLTYVDSSSRDRLDGKFDLSLEGPVASLDADMKIAARDGTTRFTPRITSSWALGPRVDVRTVLQTGDLNNDTSSTSIDTRIAIQPAARFVERVETSLLRGGDHSRESLKVSFADFDTGLEVFGGKALGFGADLRHERRGEAALTTSNLTSSLGLGNAISFVSSLKLDDGTGTGAGAGLERSILETRLVYRTPFALLKSVEGHVHRGEDGDRQRLVLTLPDVAREFSDGSSYEVSSKVLIHETALANGSESRRIGFETRLSRLFATPLGGRNSLSFDVERGLGRENFEAATLSYNHEWAPTEQAQVALKLRTKHRENTLEPSMDINWSARF
ncbi:MAG TPA: hypothetical protein VMR74_10365 [Gammaproteobacteria bacterium]|nr:hypothetical protein [Gammaproteobacteria bacterium]